MRDCGTYDDNESKSNGNIPCVEFTNNFKKIKRFSKYKERELRVQFAKIVERHPEIYNHNLAAYKTGQADAWEKVRSSVRTELKEECTVKELIKKWRSMRCSFSRYKSECLNPSDGPGPFKKYYLYEALHFLEPFIKTKGRLQKDITFEDCGTHDDNESKSNGNIPCVEFTNNFKKRKRFRKYKKHMVQFVKIVERHPEIYNYNLEAYRTQQADTAWEKVCSSVRTKLKKECTVEELKKKWRSLRCSFNAYKSKCLDPKKYYLYEALHFLEPFIRTKGRLQKNITFEDCGTYDESKSNGNIPFVEFTNNFKKIKPFSKYKEQEFMVQFAKIVERHPEIYNYNLEAYKTQQADTAWEKVCSSVRTELKEEFTVEQLKMKWRCMRGSFSRYKSKLLNPSDGLGPVRKYYLNEALHFLEPFTRPKGRLQKDSTFEECGIYDDNESKSNDNIPSVEYSNNSKKRKCSSEDKDVDDEALEFFKSILPDIKDFTNQEKRKLKLGVFQLIDDLENERKQQ